MRIFLTLLTLLAFNASSHEPAQHRYELHLLQGECISSAPCRNRRVYVMRWSNEEDIAIFATRKGCTGAGAKITLDQDVYVGFVCVPHHPKKTS
jgi:hypothetical protein